MKPDLAEIRARDAAWGAVTPGEETWSRWRLSEAYFDAAYDRRVLLALLTPERLAAHDGDDCQPRDCNEAVAAALEALRAEVMGMVALGVLVDNRRGVLALIDARLEKMDEALR